MHDTKKTSLVNDALFMAIKQRQLNKGIIYHIDRRSQYASDAHKELLQQFKYHSKY